MRRWLPLLVLVVLSGCHKDFDSQYAETEKQMKAEAKQLDIDMAKAAKLEPGETAKKKPPIR